MPTFQQLTILLVPLLGSTGPHARSQTRADSDAFGRSVYGITDVNGDGTDDLVVGDPSFESRGALWTISGKDGSRIAMAVGQSERSWLGGPLFIVEDEDGDGLPEVAAITGGEGGTAFRVLSGQSLRHGRSMEILAVDKSSYLQAWAVSDLDADGHSDIALGVVTRSESFIDLMSGKTCKRLLRIKTPLSRCNAASAVACLGDLDGDSVPDLGVGSGRCAAAASRYRVSIFSGKTGAVLGQLVDGEPAAGFGSAIGAVTDLDGDGVTDIVLVDDANGRSSVYSGRERRFVRHLEGSWNEARGASEMGGVSLLRDLNGDGVRDFAVAVDALLEARVRVYSGKDGSLIRSHSEPGVPGFSGRFAACVADVGDLDHDGKGDYAVGASHGICGFAHGFVAAYSGGSGGILFIVNARQLSAR